MSRQVVYATATVHLPGDDGAQVLVRHGTHWFADDPVVQANPGMFSASPCYGLSWSGPPPEEMSQPPEVEQATAAPGERRSTRRLPNVLGEESRG